MRSGVIRGVRVSHERADMDALEGARHADPAARIDALLDSPSVTESFVLQTCNRVEEYVVVEAGADQPGRFGDFEAVPASAVVEMDHRASLSHLLRVAAGVESQVLGEDQILGQVRDAYEMAADRGAIGPVLEPALLKAIHVGERARTETAINDGTVSLGSAAVRLAEQERGLEDAIVAVIGAGTMARTVAKSMPDAVAELRLLNRTEAHASAIERALDGPVRTDDLESVGPHLAAADVVVTSTGSETALLDAASFEAVGETFVVDLAQPRDVNPTAGELDHVTLHDLDGLRAVTDATHRDRREAAAEVEAIVVEELDLLLEQYKRERADDVIAAMHRGAQRIKDRELTRALGKLENLDEDERETVESLADAIVSQLMAIPTESLRDAAGDDDWETITAAIDLFDPSVDDDSRRELIESVRAARSGPTEADGRDDG